MIGEGHSTDVLGTLTYVTPKLDEFQFVKFWSEGEVAHLTLDRPEHNLLNERMLAEIATGISSVSERGEIKLIVLDSAAKAFCGGIELGEYTQRRVFQLLDAFHGAFSAMLDTSKPVLVVVNGPAFGGGAELAALGDLVIATPKARFAQPEIKLGVFPPLAAAILPYIVGPKLALELVLTGETMSAERARELGLVNWVVPADELQNKVDDVIGSGADHGKKSDPRQPGHALARRRPQLDESVLERTRRPRRLAGGPASARRKARPEVEEPLVGWPPRIAGKAALGNPLHYTHLLVI
jgi:cyclohexa-1,5-dienecarbonyl-CoA hydratase